MHVMAKKRSSRSSESPPELPPETPPESPPDPSLRERKGYNINAWISPRLGRAFEKYRKSHKYKPEKTTVVEEAITLFLTKEGFWPPPEE